MHRPYSYKYLAPAVILIITAYFVANVQLKQQEWPISLIAIIGFTTPVVVGACQWLGKRRGSLLIAALGIYALVFETIAIKTGVPYGRFQYSDLLGPHLFQAAPFTVLVAWTPLVLGVMAVNRLQRPWQRLPLAIALLVVTDLVLDPAAVKLGFWHWSTPGFYYGVPLINFVGWLVSGAIAIISLEFYLHRRRVANFGPPPMLLAYNFGAIIVFWSLVNFFAGQFIPAAIGVLLLAFVTWLIKHSVTDKTAIL